MTTAARTAPSSAERWSRIDALFNRVVDLAPADRERSLADEADIADEVRALVEASDGASVRLQSGALAAAHRQATRLLEAAEAWRASGDTEREARYWVAVASALRARIVGHAGDPQAAVVDARAARDTLASLTAEVPEDVRFAREAAYASWLLAGYLGGVGDNWGWTAATAEPAAAERELAASIEISAHIMRKDPLDTRAALEHAMIRSVLGGMLLDVDPPRAQRELAAAREVWAGLGPEARGEHYTVALEWYVHCASAVAHARAGLADAARSAARRGLAMLDSDAGKGLVDERLQCRLLVAEGEHLLGDDVAARRLVAEVIDALTPTIGPSFNDVAHYIGLAAAFALSATIDPADACAAKSRAYDTWQAFPGPVSAFVAARRAHADVARCTR